MTIENTLALIVIVVIIGIGDKIIIKRNLNVIDVKSILKFNMEIKLKNKEFQEILKRLIRKHGSETMSERIILSLSLDKEDKIFTNY